MNYHALTTTQKTSIKPLITELRKHLYGTNAKVALLKEGVTVNFGKGTEARITVNVKIVD